MADLSPLSSVLSELLDDPGRLDVASTLGLLDDPQDLLHANLDTTGMVDPSPPPPPPPPPLPLSLTSSSSLGGGCLPSDCLLSSETTALPIDYLCNESTSENLPNEMTAYASNETSKSLPSEATGFLDLLAPISFSGETTAAAVKQRDLFPEKSDDGTFVFGSPVLPHDQSRIVSIPFPVPITTQSSEVPVPIPSLSVGTVMNAVDSIHMTSSIGMGQLSAESLAAHPPTITTLTPPPVTQSADSIGESAAKDAVNISLLQFLQLNFPSLKLENIKDILQVNALLSHLTSTTHGASVSTVTEPRTVAPKPISIATTSLVSAAVPQIASSPVPATSVPMTTARTPVFAQILRKPSPVIVPRTKSGTFSSPLLLGRKSTDLTVQTTLASVPMATTSVTPSVVSTRPYTPRMTSSSLSATTRMTSKLTVVQPAETEPMDLDVGQPVCPVELPSHLKEHGYCLYNPEEGERVAGLRGRGGWGAGQKEVRVLSNIPPVRLSYAPQVRGGGYG